MNWAELSYELGRVVLVRDFIGPSGLVRVVFRPSCPAPIQMPFQASGVKGIIIKRQQLRNICF